ncbi:SidA/IucD/PvdA family monooxygenase [Acinetobacter baumannii]
MENTPFGLEHFSPDYMHYFYHLPSGLKAELPAQQANLYKGISSKTICDIYERLYHRSIGANAYRCYVGWTSSTAICRALRKPENKVVF